MIIFYYFELLFLLSTISLYFNVIHQYLVRGPNSEKLVHAQGIIYFSAKSNTIPSLNDIYIVFYIFKIPKKYDIYLVYERE